MPSSLQITSADPDGTAPAPLAAAAAMHILGSSLGKGGGSRRYSSGFGGIGGGLKETCGQQDEAAGSALEDAEGDAANRDGVSGQDG